jgi:signal transduction histidine kinase
VVLCERGEEALTRLAKGGIDLMVLDVRMPEMDGLEVCRRVRVDPRFARLPIIFLTADQADESREFLGLEVGGDEYLHKPISRRVLSARVKNLLRLADAEHEKQLMAQVAQSEKLAGIGQVAAGVAHEINNPLSFILSNLESLKGYFDDLKSVLEAWHRSESEGREREEAVDLKSALADLGPLLEETAAGGRRVRAIVQELKTFSRTDSDQLESVDLAEVVRSTLLLTEREISSKATLVRELSLARVESAPKQKLHQVTLNLVVNALHALQARPLPGDQKHTIRVATRTEGDEAILEVSDTGCGIPRENLRRIFEPFFTTKPVGVGTGLGLSVCALAVERLGGRIEVDSVVGRGTTFRVRVPCEGARAELEVPQLRASA